LKTVLEFGGVLDVVGKPIRVISIEFISQFSALTKVRCGRY
jgi:hypothetical protein